MVQKLNIFRETGSLLQNYVFCIVSIIISFEISRNDYLLYDPFLLYYNMYGYFTVHEKLKP